MNSAELQGVSRLWQNLKATLQQRTAEVESLKHQLQLLLAKHDASEETAKQRELHLHRQLESSLEEVATFQEKLQREKHERKELEHKKSTLELEKQSLQQKLKNRITENQQQTQHIEDLKQRVIAIENKSATVIGKTLIDQKELRSLQQRHTELQRVHHSLQQLNENTQSELQHAKAQLQQSSAQLQSESAGLKHTSQQAERLESKVRSLLSDNKLLAEKLEEALVKLNRKHLDRARLQRQAQELNELADQIEAARRKAKSDTQRAKTDTRRLLTILGDFYGQGKDLTAGLEDHTFVRRKQAFMQEFQSLCERYAPVDLSDGHILQDDELNYWIPQQALELLHTFQALNIPSVKVSKLESLLLSLHSVWRMRERILCEKLFRNYQTKIAVLKRQISQRKPYQEVVLSDRNQFLKAEIRRLRTELMQVQRFPTDGVAQKVEQSVALAEVLADKLARSQKEVESLKMRLYSSGVAMDGEVSTVPVHSHNRLNGRTISRTSIQDRASTSAAAMAAAMTPGRRREHEFEQSVLEKMKTSRLYDHSRDKTTKDSAPQVLSSELNVYESDDDEIFDALSTRLASIRKKVDVFHQQSQGAQ